ncbi:ATP-binding cassette domain-containing protein [Streptosporangium lutulentum]
MNQIKISGEARVGFMRLWNEARADDFESIGVVNPPGGAVSALHVAVNVLEGKKFAPGKINGNTATIPIPYTVDETNFDRYWGEARRGQRVQPGRFADPRRGSGILPVSTLLEMTGVRKRYGGVQALDGASLTAVRGEVHALLGPNGSGKSTLDKSLVGTVVPDSGEIRIDGAKARIGGPRDAHALGVAAVYQQLSIVGDLTVTQNVVLGLEQLACGGSSTTAPPATAPSPRWNGSPPRSPASCHWTGRRSLGPGEQQIVEVSKALARKPRILVLDEATASLHKEQVEVLFDVVRELRAAGVLVVFTSHRLDEVFALCDRATVLRNGRTVGTVDLAATSEDELVRLMVGDTPHRTPRPAGAPTVATADAPADAIAGRTAASAAATLEVRGLTTDQLRDVGFTVRAGEVLGLGGLQGQGQSELLLALFGAARVTAGEALLDGGRCR